MTEAEKKAKELVERFKDFQTGTIDSDVINNFKESDLKGKSKLSAMMEFSKLHKAKQGALICVEREKQQIIDFQNHDDIGDYWFFDDKLKELEQLKQAIEKL